MKFRTDFVTNSSDSSFLTFNIKNKRLFDCLTGLGIKFENVNDGEFDDGMRIVLPSGESEVIEGSENWSLPYLSDYSSISAWLVSIILWEVEEVYPAKEEEEYSEFSKELIKLLNKADVIHLDWDAVDTWSRFSMAADLEEKFGQMDADITDAVIEHAYGFEGEVGPCIFTEVKNGTKKSVTYSNNDEIETEDCDGLKFVVTGKLEQFENREEIVETIEGMGGSVIDSVSKNTDYVICNDISSSSSKMKKAATLGIPVLSEMAFIRRFCDPDDFDDIKDEDEIYDDAWDIVYDGDVLGFVMKNGTQPVEMEVWKDGKWVKNTSSQKKATEEAASSQKEKEAKTMISKILEEDNGLLKRLLLITSRDCLVSSDPEQLSVAETISFDELCDRGFLRFKHGSIEEYEAQNCYIIVKKEESKGFLGDTYHQVVFSVICKTDIADIDGYKSRPIEICSVISDIVNGKKLPDIGVLKYSMLATQVITDSIVGCTIWFTIEDKAAQIKNIIAGYDIDNGAIIQELLKDDSFKKDLGVENLSEEEVYSKGYINVTETFGKTYDSWVIINWEFAMEVSLSIVLVSKDKEKLQEMTSIVKTRISGLKLPVRGVLNYNDEFSKKEMKLSDELFAAMLAFK